MRIGVNCFMLQPHMGGLKQYFVNLFDWLLENDQENEYIFFRFAQNESELAKLRSDRWRSGAILLSDQEQISLYLRTLDVYFCPFGVLWPRPVPVPSVVTLVDIQEVFYPEFFTPLDRYSRALHFPASTRAADRVITISEFSKASITRYHGIDASKITVAYLCADPFYADPSPERVALACARFIFFPANRWHHKNHDVLLKALAVLKARGESTDAVFTGFDVQNGFPVLTKAGEYGVADLVHTAGYVTLAQMAWLYQTAEMLVFPSLFEGFGMPLVEAMASNCPAVASTSSCLPEICEDAAIYFDPQDASALADAILRVRSESRLRATLVARGKVRAQHFSPERTALAHLQAFREAAEQYSVARFRWQQLVYQPYHQFRTRLQRVFGRFKSAGEEENGGSFVFAAGWYGVEQDGSDWLRWCSGSGRLKVRLPRALLITIDCKVASLQRPNVVCLQVNGRTVSQWPIEGEFGFTDFQAVAVELRAGHNTIDLVSTCPSAVGPVDKRPLAIAVKNLCFTDDAGGMFFKLEH